MANCCAVRISMMFDEKKKAEAMRSKVSKTTIDGGDVKMGEMTVRDYLCSGITNIAGRGWSMHIAGWVKWSVTDEDAESTVRDLVVAGATEVVIWYQEDGEQLFGRYTWMVGRRVTAGAKVLTCEYVPGEAWPEEPEDGWGLWPWALTRALAAFGEIYEVAYIEPNNN